MKFESLLSVCCRSQWPRGLRRRSAAARLLRLSVRIPPGAWMFVCCECCVLSGRGLCDGLITRPGVLPTVARRFVWSRNLENEEAKASYRALKIQPQWVVTPGKQTNKLSVCCCFCRCCCSCCCRCTGLETNSALIPVGISRPTNVSISNNF
jgi:hypothetical protein